MEQVKAIADDWLTQYNEFDRMTRPVWFRQAVNTGS